MKARLSNVCKTAKTGTSYQKSGNIFFLVYNQTFTALWSKSVTVYTLQTGERLQDVTHFAISFR